MPEVVVQYRTVTEPQGTHGTTFVLEARDMARDKDGPFRAPHHTVREQALVGELALSAGGVLLLDEFSEFRRSAVRAMLMNWARMDESCRPTLAIQMETRRKRGSRYEPDPSLIRRNAAYMEMVETAIEVAKDHDSDYGPRANR